MVDYPEGRATTAQTPEPRRRQRPPLLGLLLVAALITLTALFTDGVVTESLAKTPLVATGQPAPDFALPSTDGGKASLASLRGRPVLLVFVPSVLCHWCRDELRNVQAALPQLTMKNVAIFAISTDETVVQRSTVTSLGLAFPFLGEAPTSGEHPAGSAYGLYHSPRRADTGPVETNALVAIDAGGVVRAAQVRPEQSFDEAEILSTVAAALAPGGGSR